MSVPSLPDFVPLAGLDPISLPTFAARPQTV